MKYKVFISYKHSPRSRQIAEAVERALKRYAKPFLQPPIKIFRDEKHMVPGNDLSNMIKKGLEQSEYLIFLAEEASADSKWCRNELEYWCKTLDRSNQLILVHLDDQLALDLNRDAIDWQKTNALPPILKPYLKTIPLYTDMSWVKKPEDMSLENIRFKNIINRITAKFRGVSPEEINDEEIKVYRRNRQLRNGAMITLSILFIIALFSSLLAWRQTQLAVKRELAAKLQTRIARSNELASAARQIYLEDQTYAFSIANFAWEHQQTEESALAISYITGNPKTSFYQTVLEGHPTQVTAVEVTPDGQNILTAGFDGTVRIWDYKGKELKLINLPYAALGLKLLEDGEHFLAGLSGGDLQLWQKGGNLLQSVSLSRETSALISNEDIIVTPDGNKVISRNSNGQLVILDIFGDFTPRVLVEKSEAAYTSFDLSPDGSTIAIGQSDGRIQLLDYKSKREKKRFKAHDDFVLALKFSPDGKYLLSGGEDHRAVLWSTKGQEIQNFLEHTDRVNQVLFNASGEKVVTCGEDNRVIIWDLQGNALKELKGHSSWISDVALSPDEQSILTASYDNFICIWDLERQYSKTLEGKTMQFEGRASFSQAGRYVVAGDPPLIWDLWENRSRALPMPEYITVPYTAFTPEDDQIYLVDWAWDELGFYTLDFEGRQLANKTIPFPDLEDYKMSFFPSRNHLIASKSEEVKIWRWDGQLIENITFQDTVPAIPGPTDYHPTSGLLVVGSVDNYDEDTFQEQYPVALWDRSGALLKIHDKHTDEVTDITFSPDGKFVASIDYFGNVMLWDIGQDTVITMGQHENPSSMYVGFNGITFSPDNQYILSGGEDGALRLWDLNGREVQSFHTVGGRIETVGFSRDGKYLFSGSSNGKAHLNVRWDHILKEGFAPDFREMVRENFGFKEENIQIEKR